MPFYNPTYQQDPMYFIDTKKILRKYAEHETNEENSLTPSCL